jgi:L-gulono-1,4-lactone dehydrogenase
VLGALNERARAADHFEFWTFPHSPLALTRTNNRTDAPRQAPGRRREWLEDVLMDNHVFGLLNRVGRRWPRTIPALNRGAARAASRRERVDWSYRIFASPRLVRFTEMEYAIPRERAAEALERVLALIERRRLPIGFPIELRVVRPDDGLLSTAYERPTAYIAVHQYVGMEFETYFRAVEAIMDEYEGRPHWGKSHYQSAATLRPRYPEWDRFAEIRERLDPQRRFENDYLRRVLG